MQDPLLSLVKLDSLLLEMLVLPDLMVCGANFSSRLLSKAVVVLLSKASITVSRHPGAPRNRDGRIYNPSFDK